MNDKKILNRLQSITDISSQYAPLVEGDSSKLSQGMINEIESFEKNIKSWDHLLHYHIAIAYRNYTTWHVRGEQRKQFLDKMISHLENSCALNSNFFESKIELSRVLIDENIVRNLDKALLIVSELNEKGVLPAWMNSLVEKAKRWTGSIEILTNNDFSDIDPSPAVLREERTKLRKLLTDSIKNNEDSSAIIASRLYNLGLMVANLYGDHDCNSGVAGTEYMEAFNKFKTTSKKFNFDYLGRIENASFLSETDYKRIEKVLENKSEKITIENIKNMI